MRNLAIVLLLNLLTACFLQLPVEQASTPYSETIRFRLDNIRQDGLRGPADGLTSVAYEFCVPDDENIYREIRTIDPRLMIYTGARGRIGCTHGQSLCIGETHQPEWRAILIKLASLEYITEIRETMFE